MSKNTTMPEPTKIQEVDRNEMPVDNPGPHEISELAYRLWVERGCPMGSPEEDWFRAEDELVHHPHA